MIHNETWYINSMNKAHQILHRIVCCCFQVQTKLLGQTYACGNPFGAPGSRTCLWEVAKGCQGRGPPRSHDEVMNWLIKCPCVTFVLTCFPLKCVRICRESTFSHVSGTTWDDTKLTTLLEEQANSMVAHHAFGPGVKSERNTSSLKQPLCQPVNHNTKPSQPFGLCQRNTDYNVITIWLQDIKVTCRQSTTISTTFDFKHTQKKHLTVLDLYVKSTVQSLNEQERIRDTLSFSTTTDIIVEHNSDPNESSLS